MKKNTFFLILLFLSLFLYKNVAASTSFHEAEYIPNLYVNKVKNNRIRFQQARFLRRSSDNQFAYCIEPWEVISSNAIYEDIIDINTLNDEILERMSLVAYYGYNYTGRTDTKWYYVTQLMIWQLADKEAKFYFTDSLNGNQIATYDSYITSINKDVDNHLKLPNFNTNKITLLKGQPITFYDVNNTVKNYIVTLGNNVSFERTNSNVLLKGLQTGQTNLTFTKQDENHDTPPLVYKHPDYQNFMTIGKFKSLSITIPVEVISGSIEIKKIDKDTKTKISLSDASLIGTEFELYDNNYKLLNSYKIIDNNNIIIDNLSYGTYYIKESKSGPGYKNNIEYVEVIIDNNYNKKITIENEVIKKDITIKKYYETNNGWLEEEDIIFNIYNSKNELIKTTTTDKYGLINTSLPYGEYLVKQLTVKDSYKKVDDFYIIISEKEDDIVFFEKYNELIKVSIEVPNTSIYQGDNNESNYYINKRKYFNTDTKLYSYK